MGVAMEKEIRQQPSVLAEQGPKWFDQASSALAGRRFDMVLLAARGSSDHAALYARYLIEIYLQIPVCLAAPSVLTRYGSKVKYHNCLAIGISQSGAAPDVAEVMSELKAQGNFTIGITNTAGSRLTQVTDLALLLEAGEEVSIAATKTYSASLLALYQVIRALGADLPDPQGQTPDDAWVNACHESAVESLGPVLRCEPLFSLARGINFCTAHEAALKLMECALLPCKAYSTADFAHGPKALADARTAALCFGEAAPELTESGMVLVKSLDADKGPLEPVWQAVYAQWVALLAARARGLDPDRAQNLNKVTKTL